MNDIVQSLKRAMVRQGWIYGDKAYRIGHPFEWIDGDQQPYLYGAQDILAVRQYLSMFYESYPTPEEIMTSNYEQMRAHCEDQLRKACKHFVPFLPLSSSLEANITCTALVRTQDYCFIKTHCKDLTNPVNHLDIGPGLGSHAIYSLTAFESKFYALDASPHSYAVQRHFFRFLSPYPGAYLDLVECENFNLDSETMSVELNQNSNYRVKHVPSWMFPLVQEKSIDLITATWVLNEINFSGILWLISHSSRVLRQGGYFYIRDSSKLKPKRHPINYDDLLIKMGFAEIGRLNVRNRIDYFGIPRAYQKRTDAAYSFDELAEACLGQFAVVLHGGDYVQNLESIPNREQRESRENIFNGPVSS